MWALTHIQIIPYTHDHFIVSCSIYFFFFLMRFCGYKMLVKFYDIIRHFKTTQLLWCDSAGLPKMPTCTYLPGMSVFQSRTSHTIMSSYSSVRDAINHSQGQICYICELPVTFSCNIGILTAKNDLHPAISCCSIPLGCMMLKIILSGVV